MSMPPASIGVAILEQYPCPLVEWKVLLSRAQVAHCSKDLRPADDLLARLRTAVVGIADSRSGRKDKAGISAITARKGNLLGCR